MTVHSLTSEAGAHAHSEVTVYVEGMLAGMVGAATIALWFLMLDTLEGRPFYTPTMLGTVLFRHGGTAIDIKSLKPSFETVVSFTWVHTLIFLLIGMAAAKLVDLAERDPNFGFGVIILFVVFQFGFLQVSMIVASEVLDALAWPAVLGGNLLAAAAMAAVLWRRHPRLVIAP